MKLSNIINNAYRRCRLSWTLIFTLIVLMSSPAFGMTQVGLYDVWETQVNNSKSYSNPFDFNVIELRATFTSPSGNRINFFGFHDGNGNGGQTGNVWKLRFMPDKVGTWSYTYSWTDGTAGGSGTFNVVETGLPGPLKVATDNSWYFMDSRGKPFDFRGYDTGEVVHPGETSFIAGLSKLKNVVNSSMAGKYNIMSLGGPGHIQVQGSNTASSQYWTYNGSSYDFRRYNLATWRAWDDLMNFLADKQIYLLPFDIMAQDAINALGPNGVIHFFRYFIARNAAYGHVLGWTPTWEWTDVLNSSQVNQIMGQVQGWDPFPRLLTIHDCSDNAFSSWLDFSMNQSDRGANTVFKNNARNVGQQQGSCTAQGGVGTLFLDKPIVASEHIWESETGIYDLPTNATEVRRGAWGIQMAGMMPIYSEWSYALKGALAGNGKGEPEVLRMFDFFYSKTQYRQYEQFNHLVSKSARQIASGIAGKEYLVYDEDGGSITINLSSAASSNSFSVLWYDPTTGSQKTGGSVNGGTSRTLKSPFGSDTVLLLTGMAADVLPPAIPTGLQVN